MKLPNFIPSFDFIPFFKKRYDCLGIDVEPRSVKAVRVEGSAEKGYEIASCGLLDVSFAGADAAEQKRLKAFLKQLGGVSTHAAVNIDDPTLRIRRMSFAKMPERDLIEAIKWNFREHIEYPIDECQVGYTPISSLADGDKLIYSTYCISKKALASYLDKVRQLGIKPIRVEPNATALLAAIDYNVMWKPKQTVAAFLFGDLQTSFMVMSEGELLFSRLVNSISLESFSKLIKSELKVEETKDILPVVFDGDIETVPPVAGLPEVIKTFYTQVVLEAQRSIDAFCLLFGAPHVDEIYIAGDMAYSDGLAKHMCESLGIATQMFDPFARAKMKNLEEHMKLKSSLFSVAFGLAIK